MFHIRNKEIMYNGFNFYPLTDKDSFGFVFRYGKNLPLCNLGSKLFIFRYSKKAKKLIIDNQTVVGG